MSTPVRLTEGALGLLLVVAVALVLLVYTRRRLIARGDVLVLCAVRARGTSWRPMLARLDRTALALYTPGGVSLRPVRELDRGLNAIVSVIALPRDEWPALMSDPVVLRCTTSDEDLDLAVGRSHYPAVRSWFESSPPGVRHTAA